MLDKDFPVVETDCGKLRGGGTRAGSRFLGVPYAAAPSGVHRFGAPRPPPPWRGVRDALAVGPRCPQTVENIVHWPVFSWYGQESPFGEDCCVLNVFSPAQPSGVPRPVIFYVHGGGYASGGGGGPALDGRRLATFGDLVVVTVNHRLNCYGYTQLAHAAGDGFADAANAGQLDLVAALEWVNRNIAAFGGDPGNVTLAGQSGGGNKVMVLLAMPRAKGLFRRVINMSGASGLRVAEPAHTEPYVDALMKALGASAQRPGPLWDATPEQLARARQQAMVQTRMDGAQPIVDGRHVAAAPFSAAGLALQTDVPMMIGVTDTEATLFLGQDRRNFEVDDAELLARIQSQFGYGAQAATRLVNAYRDEAPGRSAADVLAYLASDVLARGPLLGAVEARSVTARAPTFLYHFNWKIPQEGGVWRSAHTVDIPFAFGTLDRARAMTGLQDEFGSAAERVSLSLMSAFAAFAHSGHPDNAHMPQWQPYDPVRRATMVVDEECRIVHDFHGLGRAASAPLLAGTPSQWLRSPLFRGVRR